MSLQASRILVTICFSAILVVSCNNADHKGASNHGKRPDPKEQNAQRLISDSPESCERTLITDSLNTDLRLRLAAYYYSIKDFNRALFHNLILCRINKKNMAALFNLGNIYYDLEQNKKAIDYYKQFLELDENNSNVRCDLATCYMRLNKNEEAIKLLQENIKINNKHPQSHYNLSVILKQSGKIAEAEEEMKIYTQLVTGQTDNVK